MISPEESDHKARVECTTCHKTFSTEATLANHLKHAKSCIKLRGEEIPQFACESCGKILASTFALRRHYDVCKVKNKVDLVEKGINTDEEVSMNVDIKQTAEYKEVLANLVKTRAIFGALLTEGVLSEACRQELLRLFSDDKDDKDEDQKQVSDSTAHSIKTDSTSQVTYAKNSKENIETEVYLFNPFPSSTNFTPKRTDFELAKLLMTRVFVDGRGKKLYPKNVFV